MSAPSSTHSTVRPAFSWPGCKRRMAARIIARLPRHVCYVEAFAGSLAVLLAKERSSVEVVNDLDSDLVTFYRVLRYHQGELLRELAFVPNAREEFQAYLTERGLTDVQRSARWYMRLALSFGAKGDHFGYAKANGGSAASGSHVRRLENLQALAQRLDRVTVEHLDWREVLTRYDAAGTVFFLDPPYTAGLQYTSQVWAEADHVALRERIGALKGGWVLTYDDSPLVRGLYEGCVFEEIDRPAGIGNTHGQQGRRYHELIITPAVMGK